MSPEKEHLDESSVDELEKSLYRRGPKPEERARRALHAEEHGDLPSGWEAVQQGEAQDARGQVRTGPPILPKIIRVFTYTAFTFFIIALCIAGYFFFYKGNEISCDNVQIEISGPPSVPSGEELVLNATIRNNNRSPITLAELVVEYPEGTKAPHDSSVSLTTSRERIGTIESRESVRTEANALLFGKEDSTVPIFFVLEYRVNDANAVFRCETSHDVNIGTAPATLSVTGLDEVSPNQELPLTLTITSNTSETIRDQRLVIEYPYGYTFITAEPLPTNGSNVWDFGDIESGGTRTIEVTGTIDAPVTESRALRMKLGQRDPQRDTGLTALLQEVEHPVAIVDPFLKLDLSINGSTDPEVPVQPGSALRAIVTWENTLPYPLYDVEIEAALNSPLVDDRDIQQGEGYYRSVDRTLVWTGQTHPVLKQIAPGQSGSMSFIFKVVSFSDDTSTRKPMVTVGLKAKARRISDSGSVQQVLTAQAERTIAIASNVRFSYEVLHALGPFINTGPHPPQPNQETTYTAHWALVNNTSDVDNVKVVGELPIYARWLGSMNPQDGSLTYDNTTRTVSWAPGTVPAGTGSSVPPREVYFQIGILPSTTDNPQSISLFVDEPTLTGVDRHTNSMVEQSVNNVRMVQIPRQ